MSDSNLRSVASWDLQQKAGSGSFAIVWKAMHKETGKVVAIKEISTDRLNKQLKQSLESEVSILKQIRHKNIVHLEDVVEVSLTVILTGPILAILGLEYSGVTAENCHPSLHNGMESVNVTFF